MSSQHPTNREIIAASRAFEDNWCGVEDARCPFMVANPHPECFCPLFRLVEADGAAGIALAWDRYFNRYRRHRWCFRYGQ